MQKSHTTNVNKLLHERQTNPFFGVVKENHPTPPMLVVRFKNGNQKAFAYHHISKVIEYEPSIGIVLSFVDGEGATTLTIQGRNLQPLWDALTTHRITFIQELENEFEATEDGELCVTGVLVG